jgi:putative sterol carrier protein
MASLGNRDAAKGVTETYQYLVGDTAFHFVIEDGSIEVRDGRAEDPDVVVTTDEQTWADISTGKTPASLAVAAGSMSISGDKRAAKRLGRIFSRKQILARANATG